MGNEDSKPQHPAANENKQDQAQPVINLSNRPGIVVVSAGPSKHDLAITPVNKLEEKDELDPALEILQRIPPFLPLIKQTVKGWEKTQAAPHKLEPMNTTNGLELCKRYQSFLKQSANIASQEQKLIGNNLKKMETIMSRAFATLSLRANETKRHEVRFREVGNLAKSLFEIKSRIESVSEMLHKLNLILPEDKRLEKLTLANGMVIDNAGGAPSSKLSSSSSHSHSHSHTDSHADPDSSDPLVFPCSGVTAKQGQRPTMEDTHVVINSIRTRFPNACVNIPEAEQTAVYAVYDGHGGTDTAILAEKILHRAAIESSEFLHGDYKKALHNAFMYTDAIIVEKSTEEKWRNGSTAVVCMIVGNKLYTANAGDSEAVLGRRMSRDVSNLEYEPILLSKKHSPTDPSEKARIEKAGGGVFYGRVCGSLAVSRALGDLDFKDKDRPFVIATPYINEVELTNEDEVLVIACDGLWDVMSYDEAVDYVIARRQIDNISARQASQALVHEALVKRGSTDNVSVIVVYLTPPFSGQ